MSGDQASKERSILRLLRKVLGQIVKDTAPRPGRPNPLQDTTVASIRELFALISEREAELADGANVARNERPYFADEPRDTAPVTVYRPNKDGKLN
jgi:hypothetical protein